MDPIVPLCYFLAAVAVAYFVLELVVPGLKRRLIGTVKALVRR